MIPDPVTPPERDFGRRTQSLYDFEVTMQRFLTNLFSSTRLDNPAVNLLQPDIVSFDYKQRAQTLESKVPPQVVRGRVPRTVTGEIDVSALPNVPSIIVQAISGRVETQSTFIESKICVSAYDENPDGSGYQDVLNMIEAITFALAAWGQKGIDSSYVIVLPMDWKLSEENTFPHFAGEIISRWEFPTASPLPGPGELPIPAEQIEFRREIFVEQ